jgi:hypothetical protein
MHAPGQRPPALVPVGGHRSCLVDVQRHILHRSLQESRSVLWSVGLGRLQGSSKGRAFNLRQATSHTYRRRD